MPEPEPPAGYEVVMVPRHLADMIARLERNHGHARAWWALCLMGEALEHYGVTAENFDTLDAPALVLAYLRERRHTMPPAQS